VSVGVPSCEAFVSHSKLFRLILGQHLKKTSLSESSSEMDLEDGVESTPGLIGDQARIVPFLGAHNISDKQQQNCCKPTGQNLQQRHNSALAVSIETDV
jgi:hypothetical protein